MAGHGTRDCDCRGHHPLEGLGRREILGWGAAAAGIAALGPFRGFLPTASGSPQNLKRLVVLNLFGGNDSLNMFIPVKLDAYYARRPGLAVPEASALALAGSAATTQYRLHPAMPKLAALWAKGEVAAIPRTGYPDANLSHFTSQDIFSLGVRDQTTLGGALSGWVSRFTDAHAPTPMGAVGLGVGRPLDFEGGKTSSLLAYSLAGFQIYNYGWLPSQVHRLEAAKSILANWSGTGNASEAQKALGLAHDLSGQLQAALTGYTSGVAYGPSFIEQRLRDVAVLIQGGFETRLFYTGYGGFDTHGAQGAATGEHANLLGRLDGAIGSLAEDLEAMGVWDSTVVAVITEFGRRNYVNGSDGTDHGHGYTELIIGGGVRGGVYGPGLAEADLLGEYPDYAVDFRTPYKEILQVHMGLDPAPVFPEALEKETTLGIV